MLQIDKIWMEIELGFPWGQCKNYNSFCWIPFAEKGGMNISTKFWFKTSISREYYENQVEFNIPWTKSKWIDMRHKLACLCDSLPQDSFTVSLKGPAYVGTHIHYSFINDKDWEPVTYPIRNKVLILMYNIYWFYIEYFRKKISRTKPWDEYFVYPTLRNELERLVKNHNILINRDTKVFDKRIEHRLNNHNNWFIYTNGRDNIRYRPIIWSPARPWKPFTMEVRYISNLIWLDQKTVAKFNKMVEETMNSPSEFKGPEWLNKLKDLIFERYKTLYWLYEDAWHRKASKDSKNLMTINMYQKRINWKQLSFSAWDQFVYPAMNSNISNLYTYCIEVWERKFFMPGLEWKSLTKENIQSIIDWVKKYCNANKIKWKLLFKWSWDTVVYLEEDITDEDEMIKYYLSNCYKFISVLEKNQSLMNIKYKSIVTGEQWKKIVPRHLLKKEITIRDSNPFPDMWSLIAWRWSIRQETGYLKWIWSSPVIAIWFSNRNSIPWYRWAIRTFTIWNRALWFILWRALVSALRWMTSIDERGQLIQQYLNSYDTELSIINQEIWTWFDNIYTEFIYHINSYIADLEASEASAVPEDASSIPEPTSMTCDSVPVVDYVSYAASNNGYRRYEYQAAAWDNLWTFHYQ